MNELIVVPLWYVAWRVPVLHFHRWVQRTYPISTVTLATGERFIVANPKAVSGA